MEIEKDGKKVKGHDGKQCVVEIKVSMADDKPVMDIARTQSRERRAKERMLDHAQVELLGVRPTDNPFSRQAVEGKEFVGRFDAASGGGSFENVVPKPGTVLNVNGGDCRASFPAGHDQVIVMNLKIYVIQARGPGGADNPDNRQWVGDIAVDCCPKRDGVGIAWVPCKGGTREGVDVLVRVLRSNRESLTGDFELGRARKQFRGAMSRFTDLMLGDVEKNWRRADRTAREGMSERLKASRVVQVFRNGQREWRQVSDLEAEEREKLQEDIEACRKKHDAAKAAFLRHAHPLRTPYEVDQECEAAIVRLVRQMEARIADLEDQTQDRYTAAMQAYRKRVQRIEEHKHKHMIALRQALTKMEKDTEEASEEELQKGVRDAEEVMEALTKSAKELEASMREERRGLAPTLVAARVKARDAMEEETAKADEEWGAEGEAMERRHAEAVRELDAVRREAELRGKIAEVQGLLDREEAAGCDAQLLTLRRPDVPLSEDVPAGDHERATIPLRLLPARDQPRPVNLWCLFMASEGLGVREISCGRNHCLAVLRGGGGGGLWAWGGNERGQLGRGDRAGWCVPQRVQVAGGWGGEVRGVSCGDGFSMAVVGAGGGGTTVWGWGRNDSGQLGHNQSREITGWLRKRLGGVGGGWVEAFQGAGVRLWCVVKGMGADELRRVGERGGVRHRVGAVSWEVLWGWVRGLDEEYAGGNVRERGSEMRWEYSAGDHLAPSKVCQGVYVAKDGRVYENSGADAAGVACTCGLHAGDGGAGGCGAHGAPLGWRGEMAPLHVYPPMWTTRYSEDGGPHQRLRVAREGDAVRVGLYPQDLQLIETGKPSMQAGLYNQHDGPQYGSAWVEQQVGALQALMEDPLATATASVHFDGAAHYPEFHPGRKAVGSVHCGVECTVVLLGNGEVRYLGDFGAAVRRFQARPANKPKRKHTPGERRMEVIKVAEESTSMHLGILGENAKREAVYSSNTVQENVLVRAVRGAQRPRGLLRMSLTQLQRLCFPHHT